MTTCPTMTHPPLGTSERLSGVRYEIRGPLARRAHELELIGYEIIYLNIGNPGRFGFRTPETMRLAMIENLGRSEAYCHQKGIFPAREAVVMQQQNRGVTDVTADEVFLGNGVSELIDLTLRALLNHDDEVLIPSPLVRCTRSEAICCLRHWRRAQWRFRAYLSSRTRCVCVAFKPACRKPRSRPPRRCTHEYRRCVRPHRPACKDDPVL